MDRCAFVCWFLCLRLHKKLLNPFPLNPDGGWLPAQNRPCKLLIWIWMKGRIQEFWDKAPPPQHLRCWTSIHQSNSALLLVLNHTSACVVVCRQWREFLSQKSFYYFSVPPPFEHFDLRGLRPCCHERNTIRRQIYESSAAPASNLHTGKKRHYQRSRIGAEGLCILCGWDNELIYLFIKRLKSLFKSW